jgi:hypothetical protein
MAVVVIVAVQRQRLGRARSEQARIFRMTLTSSRHPGAAHVPAQAKDAVGGPHHHMQIVADEQIAQPWRSRTPAISR